MLHGGDILTLAKGAGIEPGQLLDCSASINPCGPPAWLEEVVTEALESVPHYPDPQCRVLRQAAAHVFDSSEQECLPCAGTESLIHLLPRALESRRVLVTSPCYTGYLQAADRAQCEVVQIPTGPDFSIDYTAIGDAIAPGDMVILGHPANPAGNILDISTVKKLVCENPSVYFVIDEAFIELCDGVQSFIGYAHENLVVLRSLTKCFAIPGIRVGLAFAQRPFVARLDGLLGAWSIGVIEQVVATACLRDREFLSSSRERLRSWRRAMVEALEGLPGCQVVRGRANYHLLRLPEDRTATEVAAACLSQGVAVRDGTTIPGLGPEWLRLAVCDEVGNRRCVDALKRALLLKVVM